MPEEFLYKVRAYHDAFVVAKNQKEAIRQAEFTFYNVLRVNPNKFAYRPMNFEVDLIKNKVTEV